MDKIGVVLDKIFTFTKTDKNVAGTTVAGPNVPKTGPAHADGLMNLTELAWQHPNQFFLHYYYYPGWLGVGEGLK